MLTEIRKDGMTYPIYEYTPQAAVKPVMTFAWGNGFPMEMYAPFVREIQGNYRQVGLPARSWWPETNPAELKSWHVMAQDYVAAIQEHQLAPVIGVGHSMGGVVNLISAVEHPELFHAVVLIDPVFFPRWMVRLAMLIESTGFKLTRPLVDGALKRRDQWESIEEAYTYFRGKSLFKRCSDEVVRLYTEYIVRPNGTGVELVYPKAWEAQIFRTPPLDEWRYPPKIQVPCMILAGENTNAFLPGAVRLWQQLRPDIPLKVIPETSHLLPVEQPNIVARAIQDFVEAVNKEAS